MKKAIVAFVPVPHAGYVALFRRNPFADICIISPQFVQLLDNEYGERLSRDMHVIHPVTVVKMVQPLFPKRNVLVVNSLEQLREYTDIIMPEEDISRFIERECSEKVISWETQFLTWDWSQSTLPRSVTNGQFPTVSSQQDRFFMAQAVLQAGRSSDWWRHVGAVIPYGEGAAITGFNKHMPRKDAPYIWGDPRIHMKPGEKPEICSAIHAEASVISTAAKEGIAIEGKSIYVTTFPCPVCARMIVESGIKKVFFKEGYSILDAADILVAGGVEVFQVK